MRTLVLDCNRSGDTGALSLCHLLATYVITCVWLAVFHPRISALASCQALITLGTSKVDCTVPRAPVNRQCGPVRLQLALNICLLCISPSGQPSRAVCAGSFSSSCEPTSLLICPLCCRCCRGLLILSIINVGVAFVLVHDSLFVFFILLGFQGNLNRPIRTNLGESSVSWNPVNRA